MTELTQADALFSRQPLLADAERPRPTADPAAARAAADEFEAVFLAQMLSHMFAGIDTDGPFGGGHAEQIFRSMMVNEYGRIAAQSGGLGIADQVMAEILKVQEVQE
ncbi:MAG: rod-binding protein [Alphaproteobacteria bacterium]